MQLTKLSQQQTPRGKVLQHRPAHSDGLMAILTYLALDFLLTRADLSLCREHWVSKAPQDPVVSEVSRSV